MKQRRIRLYVESRIKQSVLIPLNSDQSHYIANVMRCSDGEKIRVFNSESGEWLAIVKINKKSVSILPTELLKERSYNKARIALCFAPTKKYGEFVVEKATELGVDVIVPLLTERSVVNKINFDRYNKAAIEASEQSGRLTVPTISNMIKLSDLSSVIEEKAPDQEKIYIVCDIYENNFISVKDVLNHEISNVTSNSLLCFIIGPEGGFSEKDRQYFKGQWTRLKLGDLVLRAETAAISAMTLANILK